jgi:outer membrane protein assembly factor BamA
VKRAAILLVVACVRVAAAQPVVPQPARPTAATPHAPDLASCVQVETTPGAATWPEPPPQAVATPLPWTDFAVEGPLVDPAFTMHAMLEPTLDRYRTALTAKTVRDELAPAIAKLGYQLLASAVAPAGYELRNGRLVLHVGTLPIIRKVEVDIPKEKLLDKLFDEDVRRRMRLRVGAYLPYDKRAQECALLEEQGRIEDYLHDEGNFDAKAVAIAKINGGVVTVHVTIALGAVYELDREHLVVRTPTDVPLPISVDDIREQFHHYLSGRFRTSQFREDVAKVKRLFQKHGYPGVRIQSSFDPKISPDRRTHKVGITLTIDPRRYVDIKFDGNDRDSVTDSQLRNQLTFDQAGSTDDVEVANSAAALVTYLQQRGFFDAHVAWTRTRVSDDADQIVFHIEQGKPRDVKAVTFVGNDKTGELDDAHLASAIATKVADVATQLFGTAMAASSEQLVADIDRLHELYRRAGYREAQVGVGVTTDPACGDDPKSCAIDNAALTAAFVEAGVGDGLYVRFTIVPGERTLLERVVIEGGDDDAKAQVAGPLCDPVLHELASEASIAALARESTATCTGTKPGTPFREDDLAATRDRLRDYLYKQGRPLTAVDYEARVIGPHRIEAHYTLRKVERRRIGKIVIRGAFKTHEFVINRSLQLEEGGPLTSDVLAAAARRLRNTSLFSAVNIELFDLDGDSAYVNIIVRVEERYDHLAQIDLEFGYSSYNGVFGTAIWTQSNLLGTGMSLILTGTTGQKITDAEATLRLPKWLSPRIFSWLFPFEFQSDFTALYRQQDTPRFGELTTEGLSAAFTWIKQYQHTPDQNAHNISIGVHYDYRLSTRDVDTLRPIGADIDDQQVAVSTNTGSVGAIAEWEQRVDRRGLLAPLSAEDGFRLYGAVSIAAPLLGGDAEFIKASASGTRFFPLGKNLVVRIDGRYDEGFPLGGAVLLPDVERFFAGGDNTVRGYNDDALATEIVQTGVAPISNVSQIRVIPAGGNIRLLESIDAQYRVLRTSYGDLAAAGFQDAGMIANEWTAVTWDTVRPSLGTGMRFLTPFGAFAVEYAVPINPHLGDDPRGRFHIYFAARAQF